MCARLTKWKWLLPQLSYRGRVLIANNLVASALWHRLTVLTPPRGLINAIQKEIVDFFWSGQHWTQASVLYLPVQEGGQGLVDINSRVTAFRLQTAQRLLYSLGLPWTDTACLLLRKAGRLGYNKQLFLVQPQSVDTETRLTSFYLSVLQACQTLTAKRKTGTTPGMWIFEEPLFGNNHHLPGPVVCQPESQTDRGWTSQTGSSAEDVCPSSYRHTLHQVHQSAAQAGGGGLCFPASRP